MLGTYRAVFRAPCTAAFCAAGFVMRIPIAIYPLGLVLLISTRTGHYGFAGVLAGTYVYANGLGNPMLARLVDRYGQSRVLLPASAVHMAGVSAICILAETDSPQWTLVFPTAICGFAFLSVGSLVRARWSMVLAGRPELTTAYSLESTLDEVIFTAGPLVATGAVWLRRQHGTEPPPHPTDAPRRASAMRHRGMTLLILAAVGMGGVFGSAVAGFAYGSRPWRASVLRRFRLQAIAFGALPVLFLAAVNLPVLAVCAFVVGLGIAPLLIT